MKILQCNCGKPIYVDDGDYLKLRHRSFGCGHNKPVHDTTSMKSIVYYILDFNDDLYDHQDRDRHNNQRLNLRGCTYSQNNSNRDSKRGPSGYKGVRLTSKGKWNVRIAVNGKRTDLGTFDTAKEAAIRYNQAAIKLHGEFALLNII